MMTEAEADELYPEHAKLKKIADKSQAIGEFLDALSERGIGLGTVFHNEQEGLLMPLQRNITDLLAEHFEIDQKKIEDEKRNMLIRLRGDN